MVACSSEPNDSNPPSEGIQQESNSDAQSSEPQNEKGDTEDTEPEQPLVELAKVDLFIEEYNKAATTPITDISEMFKRCDQLVIITLMQAYTGFIKNIKHSNKRWTDLRCKSYTLTFTAWKWTRLSCKSQIVKPYTDEEG